MLDTLIVIPANSKDTAYAETKQSILEQALWLGQQLTDRVTAVLVREGKSRGQAPASLLESSGSRFEHSTSVANAKRLVYLKLMEENQNTDPFKFIIYSGKIGEQTPQMASGK
ncbi:MAG: hypothetical protein WB762_15070 [Candidatus Sulfotelmatobacter sp.]